VPDSIVIVCRPECRHSCHLDAVLDDPEELGVIPSLQGFGELGWFRMESFADVASFLARCTVAINAHLVIFLKAFSKLHFIPRFRHIRSRVGANRMDHGLLRINRSKPVWGTVAAML